MFYYDENDGKFLGSEMRTVHCQHVVKKALTEIYTATGKIKVSIPELLRHGHLLQHFACELELQWFLEKVSARGWLTFDGTFASRKKYKRY